MSNRFVKYGFFLLAPMAITLIAAIATINAAVPDAVPGAPNSWLNITPGGNASQLCFSWATNAAHTPEVKIVKTAGGDTTTFTGTSSQAFWDTVTAAASDSVCTAGWYQNQVTVTGLALSTSYTYSVGYGSTWSGFFTFQTRDTSVINLIAVGDPQIGANTSGSLEPPAQTANVLGYDSAGWQTTLTTVAQLFPNIAFMISVGDQHDNTTSKGGVDQQYNDYFCPPQLQSLPVATIEGNHDYGLGHYFGYHYNHPNLSSQDGAIFGNDGDYWFTYGAALFMVLNSNNEGGTTHDVFIRQAIAANPNAAWKIVMFHHSLYSCASHATDADIAFRRTAYPPIFDSTHIDVVLEATTTPTRAHTRCSAACR